MQKRGRFQQKIELREAIGKRNGARQALDAGQDALNGLVGNGKMENELVGIVDAEGDDVALPQYPLTDFFAVEEDPVAIASVFDAESAALVYNRGALAGDQRVGKLEVISDFTTAAHCENRFGDGNGLAGTRREI